MIQRHYPCFVLSRTNISRTCYLSFYLDSGRFFTVEESVYYDDCTGQAAQDTFI